MVERIWVEVNARVNYLIKHVLVQKIESDLDDELLCVMVIRIAAVEVEFFVSSWNEHPIPSNICT